MDTTTTPAAADPAAQAVADLMRALGTPHDEHTADTPARVAKAYRELLRGYTEDPGGHLDRQFPGPPDAGVISVQGV